MSIPRAAMETMRRPSRLAPCLVVLASLLLAACTPAQFREQYFPAFRAVPPREPLDLAMVIETTGESSVDPNLAEAFRQVMAEDLTVLFAKPQTAKDDSTDFLLRAAVSVNGLFPPTTVSVTATVSEPSTGATLASASRSAQDGTFIGELRMKNVAEQFAGKVLPEVKDDLMKALTDPQVFGRRRPRGPNVTGLLAQARTAQDAGDDRTVWTALRRALRANPADAELYVEASKLLLRLCDPDGALKVLDEGGKQGATADVLRPARDAAEQEKAAGTRNGTPACDAQALHREGVALARAQQQASAVAKFEAAAKLTPGLLPKADYNAAVLLEQLNRPKEALPHYVAAQQAFLFPQEQAEALTRLVGLAQRANIAAPDPVDRRYRLGIVRAQQKRYPEAITEFEAALAEAPWVVDAYYNLGLVYDMTGNYAEALQAFRNYVTLAPAAPNVGTVKTKIVELEDRLAAGATAPPPPPAAPVEQRREGAKKK